MTKKLPDAGSPVTIFGTIAKIKYRNADGWAVFELAEHPHGCTGTLPEMCEPGLQVTCKGTWENSRYGRQLKCSQVIPAAPDISSDAGVIRLLQRLPGIGPRKAMKAVAEYDASEAWEYACTDPVKIGVHPDDAEKAIQIANSLLSSYEATVYLLGLGLTDYQASKIYRHYGSDTIETVSQNPYQLTEIDGFGFLTVDKIALKAGMSVSNPARIAACVLYVLDDGSSASGHIYHNGWGLCDTVIETLTSTAMKAEVPLGEMPGKKEVRQAIYGLGREGKVVVRNQRVFSKRLIEAEEKILQFMGV